MDEVTKYYFIEELEAEKDSRVLRKYAYQLSCDNGSLNSDLLELKTENEKLRMICNMLGLRGGVEGLVNGDLHYLLKIDIRFLSKYNLRGVLCVSDWNLYEINIAWENLEFKARELTSYVVLFQYEHLRTWIYSVLDEYHSEDKELLELYFNGIKEYKHKISPLIEKRIYDDLLRCLVERYEPIFEELPKPKTFIETVPNRLRPVLKSLLDCHLSQGEPKRAAYKATTNELDRLLIQWNRI